MPPDPFRKWMIDGDYPPDQSFALEAHTHPGGGTLHEDLTDVTSDQHHPQSHTHASHTGIGAGDHHAAFVQADHVPYPSRVPGFVLTTAIKTDPTGKASLPPGGEAQTPSARRNVFPPGNVWSSVSATT